MSALSLHAKDWLKMYKELQKAGRQFPQYSYRHFARRRIRDYFEQYRNQQGLDSERLNGLFQECQSALVSIRRQAAISSLFPHHPLVIEGKNGKEANEEGTKK